MHYKHYLLIAVAAGLIIGAAGWLIFMPRTAGAPTTATSTSSMGSTTRVDLGNGEYLEVPAGVTVTPVSESSVPQPPKVLPIQFSADTSSDVRTAAQSQYATLSAQLKAAPTRVDLWLELGTLYKVSGDYQGAVRAWTYVAEAGPKSINYIASANLGDLYLNFLHDYAKAAAAYQAALKGAPGNPDYTASLKQAQAHL